MTSPGHIVLSLVALKPLRWPAPAIAAGAVIPDAALWIFYGTQRFVLGHPEWHIWGPAYRSPAWRAFLDAGHSLPLVALGMLLAAWRRVRWAVALFASMAIHALLDLLLHYDDAHRHLFPLLDWRFRSPVSYWDPNRYGQLVMPLEAGLIAAGIFWWLAAPGAARGRAAVPAALAVTAGYGVYAAFLLTT